MMTKVSGKNVVAAPCCRALYTTPAYGSINLSASEYWTDGQRVHSLFPNDGGLRSCICGSYFLLKDTEKIDFIPDAKPIAPQGWEHIKSNWWTRFWGKETKEQVMAFYDIRPIDVIKAEQKAVPPATQLVKDEELSTVIHDSFGDDDILIVARRRYWRYLNDAYRELYRQHQEIEPDTFPVFEPTEVQTNNMLALLDLLLSPHQRGVDLEVIEILRELGRFQEAASRIDRIEDQNDVLYQILSDLNTRHITAPVRFRYN